MVDVSILLNRKKSDIKIIDDEERYNVDTKKLEIKTFIIDNFLFGSGGEKFTPEASLLEQGIIDSTGILELVEFLEQTYDITVDDQELIPDNLDSLNSIAAYVTRKQKGPAHAAAETESG